MKIPEFIPFKFGKFESNLQRRLGVVGIGRWALLRKAVGETPNLTIDINDMIDRETLELDLGCTAVELVEFLEYSADRRAIDRDLYEAGIIWIEGLEDDLKSFYGAGKRPIPKRPAIFRKNSETLPHLSEKFQDVQETIGISEHERTNERTERKERTNEQAFEDFSPITKQIQEWAETFGTIGNRYKTEPAYLESFQLLKNEGKTATEAHEILKAAAAKDRVFCIATKRKRKDPHSWLQNRDWSRDYDNEMKLYKEENQETAKGGIQNGASKNHRDAAREYANAAKRHAEDSGL
jgi:hypothetical protein